MEKDNALEFDGLPTGIFQVLNVFLGLIIFASNTCFKRRKSMEDKYMITKVFFFILYSFFSFLMLIFDLYYHYYRLVIEAGFFIIILGYLFDVLSLSEKRKSILNPSYLLSSYITNENFRFFLILVFFFFIMILKAFCAFIFFYSRRWEIIYVLYVLFHGLFMVICTIINLTLNVLNKKVLKNLRFDSKKSFKWNYSLNIVSCLVLLIFAVLFIAQVLTKYYYYYYYYYYYLFESLQFEISFFFFLDQFLMTWKIYKSSFYYYSLGNTNMGQVYCCFGCSNASYYEGNFAISLNEFESYRTNDVEYFLSSLYIGIGFTIDDFIVDSFDFVTNCSIASMCLSYNDFSKNKMMINVKDIEQIEASYSKRIDYFKQFRISIELDSFFNSEIQQIMDIHQINKDNVIKSLLSNEFTSLLSKNAKDPYFRSQKTRNFILKSHDKKLLLEFHSEGKLNDKLRLALNSYFTHIISLKMNTFLPLVIGVFRVKVKPFEPLLIIVMVNQLVEDIPKEHYNFWETVRFKYPEQLTKVNSSKEKDSYILTTENIFESEKTYSIEQYDLFTQTLFSDISFFKKFHNKNFSMLLLYYEVGLDKSIKKDPTPEDAKIDVDKLALNLPLMDAKDDFNSLPRMPLKYTDVEEKFDKLGDENLSVIKFVNDISKSTLIKNGFSCRYNDYKGILYVSFENLFDFTSSITRTDFYSRYTENFLKKFENSYSNINDNSINFNH